MMLTDISKTLSSFNVLDKSDLLNLSTNNTNTPTAFASNFTGGKKSKPKTIVGAKPKTIVGAKPKTIVGAKPKTTGGAKSTATKKTKPK
jgi:hypothetical protein